MVLPFLAAMAPFAPIIGGAIGALGSLFAPKPEPQRSSIDLKKLRADADAAGFNPLTIIRGGGLAGYGVQSAGPDMRLSNALQTFGSGVAQWQYDPYAEKRFSTEQALAQAQIAAFGRQGAPANASFQTPKAVGTSGGSVRGFGIDLDFSPEWDGAQEWTDRHGEPAEWMTFIPRLIYDAGKTAQKWYNPVLTKRGGPEAVPFGDSPAPFLDQWPPSNPVGAR